MRILRSLVAAILLATLASCGDSGNSTPATNYKPGDKIKIGFLVKQPDDPWFQNEWKFASQAAEKDGFEVIKIGLKENNAVLPAIDNLAAQGAQGFIICTPDPKLGQTIVDRAARSGLKVMSVDDQLQTPDGKVIDSVPHMGISARAIGNTVGEALVQEFKKRNWSTADIGACILTHDPGGPTHMDRTEGAIEALRAAGVPADHIFKIPQKEELGLATGRDAMNAALTQHPEIKNWLIAGVNDGSVAGAVRATEARALTPDHVIGVGIGADSSLSDLSQAAPTGFVATVLISPRRHGYETADLMYHWIKEGKTPDLLTKTTGRLISRDNFKQIMKEEGLSE